VRFRTEITTRTASAETAPEPDVALAEYQTEGRFRKAGVEVDLREINAAGEILRQLAPLYLEGLEAHPMARSASFGLLKRRVLTAARRLAAAPDAELEQVKRRAAQAVTLIAREKDEAAARRLYNSERVQSALFQWAFAETARMVSKKLAVSRQGLDEEDADDLAIHIVTNVFREDSKSGGGKKSPFTLIRTHDFNQSTDPLQTLRVYLSTAVKHSVSDHNRSDYQAGMNLGHKDDDDNHQQGLEDIVADDTNNPMEALLNSSTSKMEQVAQMRRVFNTQKRSFEKELNRPAPATNPTAVAKQKQMAQRYKAITELVEPKLDELEMVARKIEAVNNARVSPEQKEAKMQEFLAEYQGIFAELGKISQSYESSDLEEQQYQEGQSALARERAEKERFKKQREMEKQGLPVENGTLDEIDPNAAAAAAEQKSLKKHVVDHTSGKFLISPVDYQAEQMSALKLADTLVPYVLWAATFKAGTDVAADPRNGKIFNNDNIRLLIRDKATIERALSPDPNVRVTAPPQVLGYVAFLKAMIALRHMDGFDAKYVVKQDEASPRERSALLNNLPNLLNEVIQRDPAMDARKDEVVRAVDAIPGKDSIMKLTDYYTRVGAYQWAKSQIAGDEPWANLTPEQEQGVADKVYDTLYDNDHRVMTVSPATGAIRVLNNLPKDTIDLEKRELIQNELTRLLRIKRNNEPIRWEATTNDFLAARQKHNPNGALRTRGRARELSHTGTEDLLAGKRGKRMLREQVQQSPVVAPPAANAGAPSPAVGADLGAGPLVPQPGMDEEQVLASRIDLLVRVGTRLEKQGNVLEAARVARVVAGLLK
jgi:hypothetical protein